MFDTTLDQLENLIGRLLQQNSELTAANAQLQQQLQSLTEENDTLQLERMEQEEKLASAQSRLQGLVEKALAATASEQSTPA